MPPVSDGPSSKQFTPLNFRGDLELCDLARCGVSKDMADQVQHTQCIGCVVCRGAWCAG